MADFRDRISKAKPVAPSKFIIMGEPMSGKTTLAAKAPRPFFISTDGNAAKAGLDAVEADTLGTVAEAIEFFENAEEYDTLVIDTVEGIADLFEKSVIDQYNRENGAMVQALNDVAYGKLTGVFNNRIQMFSETLAAINKNVIITTYTKREIDELTGGFKLGSELKTIRRFTRFTDAILLTIYDGEHYRANVTSKRTVMAGEVDYGNIEPFLKAAGWTLPSRKTKLGKK